MSDYVVELSDGSVHPIEADSDDHAVDRAIMRFGAHSGLHITRVYVGHPYLPSLRVVWRLDEAPDDPAEFERGRRVARRDFAGAVQFSNIDSWESLYWALKHFPDAQRSYHLGYVHEARRMWREARGMDTDS